MTKQSKKSEETPGDESLEKKPLIIGDKIESEEQAVEFVRKNYNVPKDTRVVHVSEDKQVFYRTNSARAYANEKGVKIFSITWD